MSAAAEPIVLIDRGGALLSVVSARLAMAGDTPITASDCVDPKLVPALRSTALLVIEARRIAPDPTQAVNSLRAMGWNGKLLIIVDQLPDGEPPAQVRWVSKRGGTSAVMSALANLRG
ncbi:MAG: hypothetical protein JWP15_1724 [Alphaproteobacteria bacterium]|nr:hypothetical protein [Alphaproteobacteria bacterium]